MGTRGPRGSACGVCPHSRLVECGYEIGPPWEGVCVGLEDPARGAGSLGAEGGSLLLLSSADSGVQRKM